MAATLISDDHVVADEKGIFIGEMFPTIQAGYILTEINFVPTEDQAFDGILALIRNTKPPHRAFFKRYDMRKDPLTGEWATLEQLRDDGVCVEDPRLPVRIMHV